MAHILVVDDEPEVLALIATILRKEGHNVTEAKDPLRAIEVIGLFKPELLIIDMDLPSMHGTQLVEVLRGARSRFLPAIAVTGSDIDSDEVRAAGFIDLVRKPFERAELVRAVRGALP